MNTIVPQDSLYYEKKTKKKENNRRENRERESYLNKYEKKLVDVLIIRTKHNLFYSEIKIKKYAFTYSGCSIAVGIVMSVSELY